MRLLGVLRLFSIAVVLSPCWHAQAERPDSIAGLSATDSIPAYLLPRGVTRTEINEIQIPAAIGSESEIPVLKSAESMSVPTFQLNGLTSPSIFSWHGGQLSSVRGSIAMPGIS